MINLINLIILIKNFYFLLNQIFWNYLIWDNNNYDKLIFNHFIYYISVKVNYYFSILYVLNLFMNNKYLFS